MHESLTVLTIDKLSLRVDYDRDIISEVAISDSRLPVTVKKEKERE